MVKWPQTIDRILDFNRPVQPKSHNLPGELIVSLTSYPPRYPTLPYTIRCLLAQTVAPDRIILWIHSDHKGGLPELHPRVSVREYDRPLKSYAKIIPTLQNWPESFIVTCDDDLYYAPTWLEDMVRAYDGDTRVYAHRAHRIRLGEDGYPITYRSWVHPHDEPGSGPMFFATGGAGCLYPPAALHADVTEWDTALKRCPTGDDIWLYWQTRRADNVVCKIPSNFELCFWPGSQRHSLCHANVGRRKNDDQIKSMIQYEDIFK